MNINTACAIVGWLKATLSTTDLSGVTFTFMSTVQGWGVRYSAAEVASA